ncbi:MAG: phenylalanine--tRNA ligase subunit beta [Proteobacteria bacterium]|nr:phenylalanine--tRNA ligase subunit beta [Pseudomonadota bacterium]
MKVSENWLRELVPLSADHPALVERLNMIGHEVEDDAPVGESLEGVAVARIVECAKHPQADRLQVCRVDAGGGILQVVCGAPNARAGLLAPLAKVGATLPGGIVIKAAQLRGVESHGMLCSAKELGLDADASGLLELPDDAPVGAPLADYLCLPDHVLDLGLTPNRADCLSMNGLAADVAAAFGMRFDPPVVGVIPPSSARRIEIGVEAVADCPRYCGRCIEGIDPSARTPRWMRERLQRSGVRPVGFPVDVTQYVMLELGQPMHAFDAAKLQGPIGARRARAGETLKLLDEREAALDPDFLVITDADRPVALGGVMGGFDTRVSEGTHDVFLEAAHFAPAAIAGRARKLAMQTDAAHRFERGVDPALPRIALERAAALILETAGGRAGPILETASPQYLPERSQVLLRRARIPRVLGITIADGEVARILESLDMRVEPAQDGWRVTPPSRRFDIEREEDLIEEVARIHGYAEIPARLPAGEPPAPVDDETRLPQGALRAQMVARDYREAVCYAFVDAGLLKTWNLDERAIPLANPLSADLGVMRTSLLPGLVEALRANRNRQQARVRLFETGTVFLRGHGNAPQRQPVAAPVERTMLAAVSCGAARSEQWGERSRAVDFFDLKGDLESLLAMTGEAPAWSFDRESLPSWLHPGRAARVLREGRPVGVLGSLHPQLLRMLDLDQDVYVFEAGIDALTRRGLPSAHGLPRFPSVRRDIAVELPHTVAWSDVGSLLRGTLGAILVQVLIFDVYTGQNLKEGEKSLAIGLILQDDSRTLTVEDADHGVAAAVAALETAFGARLRS